MRELSVAFGASESESQLVLERLGWGELYELLTTPAVRESKSGPVWIPAKFSAPQRQASNVEQLELLVFDLDETSEAQLDELASRLEASGAAFAIHTTHSHTDEAGCARLSVPLSTPVSPHEALAVRQQLANELALDVDPRTNDIARLYYLPSHRPGAPYLSYGSATGSWHVPRKANAAVDLSSHYKSASRIKSDADRKALEDFLGGRLKIEKGGRDNTIHRVMSLFTAAGDAAPSEELAKDLLERTLDRMDCEPEGRQHWLDKGLYSYRRGVEHRRKNQEALDKLRSALSDTAQAIALGEDWRTKLLVEKDKSGNPIGFKGLGVNLALILEHDENFRGQIAWNVLTKRIEVLGGPLATENYETLDVALSNWLQSSTYALNLPRHEVAAQLMHAARRHEYDPLQRYLEQLPTWDGKPRLERLLLDHAGAVGHAEYIGQATRKFFISAVARAMKPGTKVDTMLLLHGPQGVGKSQFVAAIASPWSTSARLDIHNKDSVLVMTGNWVVELAELASLRGRDIEAVKAFLSSPSDQLRVPYGRAVEDFPRRSVFIGTTNDDQPLSDPTGNRRFWPVSVMRVDVDAIRAQRDQLWAEALQAWKAGERWWFSVNEEPLVASETEVYRQEDMMPEVLLHWYVKLRQPRPEYVTVRQAAQAALMIMPSDLNNRMVRQIGSALKGLGFKLVRMRTYRGGPQLPHWEAPQHLRDADFMALSKEDAR